MSVSFPLRSWEQAGEVWDARRVRYPDTPEAAWQLGGSVKVEGVNVFVGAANVPATGAVWGKIEFNPSRIVDPDGSSLAPVVELPTVARKVWKAARDLVEPACGMGDARVKRLDVARDFDVSQPGFFIRGLGPIPRPWARRTFVYNDPNKGLAETLFVGSGAGGVRLYDKHKESPAKSPVGRLRWETEARDRWLANYGEINTLRDVSVEKVEALALDRWRWSAMGVEVCAVDRLVELVATSGLSGAKQRGFLGHLLLVAKGRPSKLAKETAAEYNRLLRQFGVVLSDGLFEEDGQVVKLSARLDWATGRDIVTGRAA